MFTKKDIEDYFVAEKKGGKLFIIMGFMAIIAGLILFVAGKTTFYKGASLPPTVIGAILFIAGYTVFKRSDEDRKRNVYNYDMNPAELRNKELPRMQKVMKRFASYRWAEIFLAIFGLVLFFRFYIVCEGDTCRFSFFRKGMGLTLTIMSLMALIADYIAEKWARVYLKGLESFAKMTS
jgi:hypothetical protein